MTNKWAGWVEKKEKQEEVDIQRVPRPLATLGPWSKIRQVIPVIALLFRIQTKLVMFATDVKHILHKNTVPACFRKAAH